MLHVVQDGHQLRRIGICRSAQHRKPTQILRKQFVFPDCLDQKILSSACTGLSCQPCKIVITSAHRGKLRYIPRPGVKAEQFLQLFAIRSFSAASLRKLQEQGEKVDVALVDSVVSAMENITMIYQTEGRVPQRIGNRYESTYPYDVFPTSDGSAVIAAGNDKLFGILCDVIGRPELKTDPLYAKTPDRVTNHEALGEILSAWTLSHTTDEIDRILNAAGCPACPVNTIDRMVTDPQIAGAREMFPEIDQPGVGKMRVTATAQKLTRTKACPRKAAPELGEDNLGIYGGLLGYRAERLAELKEQGVI